MLSSVTINSQITKIVTNSGFQLLYRVYNVCQEKGDACFFPQPWRYLFSPHFSFPSSTTRESEDDQDDEDDENDEGDENDEDDEDDEDDEEDEDDEDDEGDENDEDDEDNEDNEDKW